MLTQTLSALTLVLPMTFAFYLAPDYDMPDQKFLRRNAYGQIQAFDASYDHKYVQNAYGGVSAVRVAEFSDPDYYHTGGFLPSPIGYTGGQFQQMLPGPFRHQMRPIMQHY